MAARHDFRKTKRNSLIMQCFVFTFFAPIEGVHPFQFHVPNVAFAAAPTPPSTTAMAAAEALHLCIS